MNKKLPALVFIMVLVVVLLVPTVGSAEPFIGEGDLHKEAEVETEVLFKWTVYRNSTFTSVVRVEVDGDLEEWVTDISPDHFVLDDSGPYQIVTVSMEVPRHPSKNSYEGRVLFYYRPINSTEYDMISRDISVRIRGVAPAPESNTLIGGYPNPLPEPLDNPYGAFILNMAFWVALGWVFYFLVSPIIHGLTKKTKTDVDEIVIRMLRRPILGLIILYGFIDSFMKLNLTMGIRTTMYQIYMVLVLVMGGIIIYRIFDTVLHQIAIERGGMNTSFAKVLKPMLEKSLAVIITVAALLMVLRVLGIEATALLAGAGVIGLVVAFAAQDTLGNFFSGMHILLDRPFVIGDIILLENGDYCKVEEIGMRSTKLYNIREHEGIVLPNNSLANQMIINVTKPDISIKVRVEVGVAYGSDVQKVKRILREVAEEHPNVIDDEEHPIAVRFRNFGDSSLDFGLRVWIDDISKQWSIMSDLRERIDQRFREENIEIPFPQRTLWLHEMEKG